MNAHQRRKVRRSGKLMACPECGERGPHWVPLNHCWFAQLDDKSIEEDGFWTCDKFYGPDGKRVGL